MNIEPLNIRYRGYYYDAEAGFYYLNSRYYDSEIGRWINSDNVISGVGGSELGYNLFTYCFNNPINMTDPEGNLPKPIKKVIKHIAKNVLKPTVDKLESIISKGNGTCSYGINFSGTPGKYSFNAQAGISIDTSGNVAIQSSSGDGVTTGTPSASLTFYHTTTNAPNIYKLEGTGYQVGGSVAALVEGIPLAGGADFNIIPDKVLGRTYFGITENIGIGVPGKEVHIELGDTVTWKKMQFNVFDVVDQVYIKIMEW